MIVAITGGIGCGKSRVADYLVKIGQAQHCDTDQYCRDLLRYGQTGWQGVVAKWENRFLDNKGSIDRPLLRRTIFEDSIVRKELETILHPLVRHHVAQLKAKSADSGTLLVVEVPLLYEVGWQSDFDKVITVFATKEECVKRVMSRDCVTATEAEKITEVQMPLEEKMQLADYIIDNSGIWQATCRQIEDVLRQLKNLQTAT